MLKLSAAKVPALGLADQLLFTVSNFLLQILIARTVSPESFGAYTVGSTFFFLAAIVHQTFIVEPMFVFSGRRYNDILGQYHYIIRRDWSWIFGGLVIAAGLIISLASFAAGSRLLSLSFALYALTSPVVLYFWLLRRMVFLLGRMDLAVLGSGIYASTCLVGAALLLATGALSMTTGILLTGVGASLASIAVCRLAPWGAVLGQRPAGILKQHIRYGRWAFGSEAVNWLIANGPLLLLPIWLGFASSGLLRVLNLLSMPVLQVLSAMTTILLRSLSSTAFDSLSKRKLIKFFFISTLFSAFYACVLYYAGPILIPLIFGPSYEFEPYTLFLSGSYLVFFVGAQAFFICLRAAERTGDVLTVHLLVLVMIFIFSFFVGNIGISGILAAQSAAWFVGLAASYCYVVRLFKFNAKV